MFLGQTHFENYLWDYVFLKSVDPIIYEKCFIFNIAYGKMHELLT